ALRFINADDRDVWVKMGMALRSHLGDAGYPVWDRWSQSSQKYNARDQQHKWRSFNGSGVGIGTLFHHAQERGWRPRELQLTKAGKPLAAATAAADALVMLCADKVKMRAVEWLWPNRFARGAFGVIAGLPDMGKGQIAAFIAAALTAGIEFPCKEGMAPQGNVLWFNAEDSVSATIVPRLMAAGADLARIRFVSRPGK